MDFKALGKFEQGALIAGVVTFVFSFFERYRKIDVFDQTYGVNAWEGYATLGMLLIIAATALVAVKAFAPHVLPAGVPWNLITLALAALGTFLVILRNLTLDGGSVGWSGVIVFIGAIALTVFTALSFRTSGEKLPEFKKPAA